MANITTRQTPGGTGVTNNDGPLSNAQLDTNFINLNTDKLELGGTYSSGTANGVTYLNSSKVLTTSSALTFDGTTLGVRATSFTPSSSASSVFIEDKTTWSQGLQFYLNNAGTYFSSRPSGALGAANSGGLILSAGALVTNDPDGSNGFTATASSASVYRPVSGVHIWYANTGLTAGNTFTASEQMRLTSSGLEVKQSQLIGYSSYAGIGTNGLAVAGNVGIGTSSPGAKLDVFGNGNIVRYGDGTNTFNVRFKGPNNWDQQLDTAADKFSIRRNSVDFVVVDSSGNLGIGTSSPAGKLSSVVTAAGAASLTLERTASSRFEFQQGITAVTGDALRIIDTTLSRDYLMLRDGNLGIGTISPGQKLEVAGNILINTSGNPTMTVKTSGAGNNPGYLLTADTNTWGMYGIFSDANDTLQWQYNGTTRLTLTNDGNLGLGVTPSAWFSTIRALQIGSVGGASIAGNTSAGGSATIGLNVYFDAAAATARYGASSFASRYTQFNGAHEWFTAPSGTAGNAISFTQAMTLSGTAGPALRVGVTADLQGFNFQAANQVGFSVHNSASSATAAYFSAASNVTLTSAGSSAVVNGVDGILLGVNATERARISSDGTFRVKGAGTAGSTDAVQFSGSAPASTLILDSSGNLGIGTSSPATKLNVKGTDPIIRMETPDNAMDICYITSGGPSAQRIRIGSAGGATDVGLTVLNSGNVGIGTSSPTSKLSVTQALQGNAVGTGAELLMTTSTATNDRLNLNFSMTGIENRARAGIGAVALDASGGYNLGLAFYTRSSADGSELAIGDEKMRLDSSGGLRLGTTNAYGRLTINGSLQNSFQSSGNSVQNNAGAMVRYYVTNPLDASSGSSNRVTGFYGYSVDESGSPAQTMYFARMNNYYGQANINYDSQIYYHTTTQYHYRAYSEVGGYDTWWVKPATNIDTVSGTRADMYLSGNFGIGTTSPTGKLTVKTGTNENLNILTGGSGDMRLSALNDAASTTVQLSIQAAPLYFRGTGGAINATLNASGNLGIGTTSPQKKLHLYDGNSTVGAYQQIIEGYIGGYGAGISFQSVLVGSSTLTEMARITADGESPWNTTATTQDAGLRFYTALNGTVSEKMRLDASGNLLVGTISPSANSKITSNGGVAIAGGRGTGYALNYADWSVYNSTTGNALVFDNGTERARITSGGNFNLSIPPAAINTTTPGTGTYGLNFTGSNSTDYAQGITWSWSGTTAQAGIYVQSSGAYGTKMYIATTDSFAAGAKTAVSIDHVGNVSVTRGSLSVLNAITQNGNQVLHASNYSSYALPLSGGTMSGPILMQGTQRITNAGFAGIEYWNNGAWQVYIGSENNAAGSRFNAANGVHTWYNNSTQTMQLSGSALTVTGLVTAPNFADSTGSYNVNLGSGGTEGRGLVAGYSGGWYGGIGYNVRHTASSGVIVAPLSDTSSYLAFNAGGFIFYGAAAGAVGRTLGFSTPLATLGLSGTFNTLGAITQSGNQVLHASNYSSYALPLSGGTLTGHLTGTTANFTGGFANNDNGLRIANPGGASFSTAASTVTGAIKIRIPAAALGSGTMISFRVRVYQYITGLTQEFVIAGYNYSDASYTWYNVSALNLCDAGIDYTVRFGKDATSQCIYIGELNSSWSYPQVHVVDFSGGYSATSYSTWATGWNISFETSAFAGVTATRTASRQLHASNYNSYSPTLTGGGASGTWGINVTGTAGSISGFNNPTTAATGNTIVYRDGSGNVTAVDFNSTSDLRLKENIVALDGIELLADVNPVEFTWKNSGKKSYGVIAQELEQVLPELVCEGTDGTKSVHYIPIIAMLIDAVKTLDARVAELETK